jgi:hypothetical protein
MAEILYFINQRHFGFGVDGRTICYILGSKQSFFLFAREEVAVFSCYKLTASIRI